MTTNNKKPDAPTAHPHSEELVTSVRVSDQPLRECVRDALDRYMDHIDQEDNPSIYQMLLSEVEQPMLECVLRRCNQNQTQAAKLLGINRGTLRKKLKEYELS